MFEQKICPVCGSAESRLHEKRATNRHLRCLGCGAVYLAERAARIADIYDASYYQSDSHQFGYENYKALRPAIHRSADLRFSRIERLTGGPGRVLDIGCACGYYLEGARNRGWEVNGVDISSWAVANAEKDMKDRLVCADILKNNPFPDGTFDCVTLWDLIEQTPGPRQVLESAHRALKSGGWVALMFRDIDSAVSRALKAKWIHYRPDEKYVYLTPKSAGVLMQKTGFGNVRIESRATGKDTTLKNLTEKMETYSAPIAGLLAGFFKAAGLQNKMIYLNFMDTRIAYAQKI